ncbi:MAG: AmmeMemoRadiSam system radical SAM enzyme [Synergistaceae bacterium]|nr:AmmeMemoRadiSam system radical SAM enzyme [Synergistaceae bacterium]
MNAKFYRKNSDGSATCNLCFRGCKINEGNSGFCGVRENKDGELISPMLGKFCAVAVDPIEKKPLFHWRPGTFIYSLGSLGCTMDCPFCQNFQIAKPSRKINCSSISPHELVKNIHELELNSVAFTYNEPTLQAEYICECSKLFHENNIAIVLVTNGAMSNEAASSLIASLKLTGGAANIDVKAFDEKVYAKLGGSLEIVKANVKSFVDADIHTELTSLIVPGLNDDTEKFSQMVEWIASLSRDIPLHVTRYFPRRFYNEPPTDKNILYSLASIAKSKLKFVHVGNV